MQVSVLKRDNGEGYMFKMLFRDRHFRDYEFIMPYVREHYGYKLADEFLILPNYASARRVTIVVGDILPEWGVV